MFPRLYMNNKNKRRTVWDALCNDNWIRDIIHDIWDALCNDNWIRDIIHDIAVPEIAEYMLLWELVAEAGFDN
jgi:hypothetical protein